MVRLAAFLGPQTGQNPCWSLWERWYNNWAIFGDWLPRRIQENMEPDFSVVLFRPNFMLASEGYPMKAHKNQRLLTLPSPPNLPCGATNQGTYHGVWWADAFAVT
jgi:hypothetical protein